MATDKPDELASILGRALVARRWAKASTAARTAHGELMNAARWKGHKRRWPKRRPKGKRPPKPPDSGPD